MMLCRARRPRIIFTCAREAGYVRNLLLLRALRCEFDVVEVTDNRPGSLLARNLRLLPRLLHVPREPHDLVFVGFYGHLLTLLLTRLTRKPLVFDAFMSTYDTLCFDREIISPQSAAGKMAYWIDQQACRHATHCLLDTATHKQYFTTMFNLDESKITPYYVGYDEETFYPCERPAQDGPFVVFYYGSYLPLHGVEYIVRAAKLLENEPGIEFRIIGEGMVHPAVRRLADELAVRHLTFRPTIPYSALPGEMAAASLCLGGPFGPTEKAGRVIAGKTYQFMGMARPTIVSDTPANRELFNDRQTALFCQPADAESLAAAILELKRDRELRDYIAQRSYELCRREFSIEKQAAKLGTILRNLL